MRYDWACRSKRVSLGFISRRIHGPKSRTLLLVSSEMAFSLSRDLQQGTPYLGRLSDYLAPRATLLKRRSASRSETMRKILAIVILASCEACSPTFSTWEAPAATPRSGVATYVLETKCESCDRRALDRSITEIVATTLPRAQRVMDPALADLTIRYLEGDSVICLDCEEEPILRFWWWSAELYTRPGTKESLFATLTGSADKLRGRPARFFRRQLATYARQRGWPANCGCSALRAVPSL